MQTNEVGFIVFTNHNGMKNQFLCRYLETLSASVDFAQSKGFPLGIVAVDDGSVDNSNLELEKFQKERKNQVSILHTDNVDVTIAVNSGIEYAMQKQPKCRYVITTDVDTALSEQFLFELMKHAEKSGNRIGMFASNQYLLRSFPRTGKHRSTGHFINERGATLDRDFLEKEKTRDKNILCPCISGALYKTEMLQEIGLTNNKYLHYNNCSELGFRAQFAGWTVEFVESAVMWHNWREHTKISSQQKEQREESRIWNILRFFPKDKIVSALEGYKKENNETSPTLEEKECLISKARLTCPKKITTIDESQKKKLYKEFISSN